LLTQQGNLKVLSPYGVITPFLLDELKAHKTEVLKILLEKYSGVPVCWSNAIEITLTRNKPKGISESRWRTIVQRLDFLVHKGMPHLLKIIEYGWSLEEVFGCHKFSPDARIDGMGLLMLLHNSTIAEVHPQKALLTSKNGSITMYSLGMMNRNQNERSTLMEIE